ncbi:MAG: ATP-binding protein [Thermoflexales bacterium]|nr:ATP-binding protein [Thermoflexales bacterium]
MTQVGDFPEKFFGLEASAERRVLGERLGVVIDGSLSKGLVVRADEPLLMKHLAEGVPVGAYVAVEGDTDRTFFGMITDVELAYMNPQARWLSLGREFQREVYLGTAFQCLFHVKLMLVLERGVPKPVRSLPLHHAAVRRATPDEVRALLSADDRVGYRIGTALDDDQIEIWINLERLIERSTGVFGRSGTGKTFLTLPLLAHVIRKDLASVLIFDMHNDYGYTLKGDRSRTFKGLKRLAAISSRIVIVTLDENSSRKRNVPYEFALQIGYNQIEPQDIEILRTELSLSDVQVNALDALQRCARDRWFAELLSDEPSEAVTQLLDSGKLSESTFAAMQRKLGKLRRFPFLKQSVSEDYVGRILEHLARGDSVVIEFGAYGNDLLAYLLVANFLTRRIHQRYVEMKERAEGGSAPEPRPLVIAIEEAHKFLDPEIARQTIFGTIARELRKYNVTLLIVDQRPSQIDAEVMSQLGTRITAALSDEKDIAAVLTGVSGAAELRNVLAALESKQQVLILGHAVSMPVAVRTTEYGEAVYREFADPLAELSPEQQAEARRKLLGRRGLHDGVL